MSSWPTINNSQLNTNSPMTETLLDELTGLLAKDLYLWSDGTGASGVDPNVEAITSFIETHDHSDNPIGEDGIASDAVRLNEMIETDAFDQSKIAANTMQAGNFANFCITPVKINGTIGWHITADPAYNADGTALHDSTHDDFNYEGDTFIVSNPKGRKGVIMQQIGGAAYLCDQSNSTLKFGFVYAYAHSSPDAGNWKDDGDGVHGIDVYFM